jgi:hypothetical protein
MQTEFARRFPTFVRHATANVPVCAGPNDVAAQQAAHEIMSTRLQPQQIVAVGTPGNTRCLLRTRPADVGADAKPLQVTMDDSVATLQLLRRPACVRIDGAGFSIEDIARVAMQPEALPLLRSAGARATGPAARWTLDMLGCVSDFNQPLADVLLCAPEQRERTLADMLTSLQRFAAWLLAVPLLSLTSVLTTWLGTNATPTPSPEEAQRMVEEASPTEWRQHATLLADWYIQQLNNAVLVMCDVKADEGMDPLAVGRLGDAMRELVDAYVRMRFVTAHMLFRAVLAFDNYLTCRERVIYGGLVPAVALLGTRAAADVPAQYEAMPTTAGNPPPCVRSSVASVGLLLRRMEQLPVVAEVRNALGHTFSTLEHTMLALFHALMWRWVYIGHMIPMLLKARRSNDRACMSLDLFALPTAPCTANVSVDSLPAVQATLRSYLSVAWASATTDGGRLTTLRVDLPHAAHPEMPTGIRARMLPNDAADAPPSRRSSIATRYNRRQKSLLDACTSARRKMITRRRVALVESAWADSVLEGSIAIPHNRARVKTISMVKVGVLNSIPLAPVGTTAPMPSLKPPKQVGAADACASLFDSICHVALEQTEPPAMQGLDGNKRTPAAYVRTRELIALIIYWFNQCQDEQRGVYVGIDLRSKLANRVGEAAEARHRNARSLCLRSNSPLFPLACRLHTERTRHRDSDITGMLFDHRPGNAVLHN